MFVYFYPEEKSVGVCNFPLRNENQRAIIPIVDNVHDRKEAAT